MCVAVCICAVRGYKENHRMNFYELLNEFYSRIECLEFFVQRCKKVEIDEKENCST